MHYTILALLIDHATCRERILPPTTPQGETLDHVPIILITPPPVQDAISSDYLTSTTTRLYGDRVQMVADRCNCRCLDLFDAFGKREECWTDDGVHLNQKGNELVYKGMTELLHKEYPQLVPMTDGNGKYGKFGIPMQKRSCGGSCADAA